MREVAATKEQAIATSFLKRADKKQYGGLWSKLENNFPTARTNIPPT
jgi:hypothetical protein